MESGSVSQDIATGMATNNWVLLVTLLDLGSLPSYETPFKLQTQMVVMNAR